MTRRPRVLLDCDGVLAGFIPAVLSLIRELGGPSYQPEDVATFDFAKALSLEPGLANAVRWTVSNRLNWWAELPVLPGATQGVAALQSVSDVWIVTSPWNSCKRWLYERERWLWRHFAIPAKRVVATQTKHIVSGDFLIDDKTETLLAWNEEQWHARRQLGSAIQWITPHNRKDGWVGRETCDWKELVTWVTQPRCRE